MKAHIITIGDEILIGQIVDTNSAYLGKQLARVGVQVARISSIPDDWDAILDAFAMTLPAAGSTRVKSGPRDQIVENSSAADGSVAHDHAFAKANPDTARIPFDLVIVTGGLGPTNDDITKKALCAYYGDTLKHHEPTLVHVRYLFEHYVKKPMLPVHYDQALLPSSCEPLKNAQGTAPGMWFNRDGRILVSMPGVPFEMKGIFKDEVLPRIQALPGLPTLLHHTYMTHGVGESEIAQWLEPIEASMTPGTGIAYLPALGRVRLRLTSTAADKATAERILEELQSRVEPLIAHVRVPYTDGDTAATQTVMALKNYRLTLALAESCTGGRIADAIVAVPGASQVFRGGVIPYATDNKTAVLDVPAATIEKHGVVSKQVAIEMADRARLLLGSDIAISTTGYAGPANTPAEKEVQGHVWIGVATQSGSYATLYEFGSARERVIGKATNQALQTAIQTAEKIALG